MSIIPTESVRDERRWPLRIAIMGATGSIGTQTLDVCRTHPDKVEVVALSAYDSVEVVVRYAREFGVRHVAIGNPQHIGDPALDELPKDCACSFGAEAVRELATLPDVDYVMNAVVGAVGIEVGHAALDADKVLCYANKESIVVGGELLMPLARPGRLIPVDSEHSAIFQCLVGERLEDLERIWLTCSGGPFYGHSRSELAAMTAGDALAHPTWDMGAKITIDSATLMNKGLEVIEAKHLFGCGIDDIRVLVQPQSRIHSMVEFRDGSVKAQLGASDMRIPIQYALSYPGRWPGQVKRVDYCQSDPLVLGEADEEAFRCLALAKEAGRVGGTLPCAMNAANEVANAAFRDGACGFLDIERIVEGVMERTDVEAVSSLEQLAEVDIASRARAVAILGELAR